MTGEPPPPTPNIPDCKTPEEAIALLIAALTRLADALLNAIPMPTTQRRRLHDRFARMVARINTLLANPPEPQPAPTAQPGRSAPHRAPVPRQRTTNAPTPSNAPQPTSPLAPAIPPAPSSDSTPDPNDLGSPKPRDPLARKRNPLCPTPRSASAHRGTAPLRKKFQKSAPTTLKTHALIVTIS